VFKAKGQAGKPLCTHPPFGYIQAPDDKLQWIIDEKAAEVVREAFRLCVSGYGPTQIAKEFTKRRYMNPTAHAKAMGIGKPDNREYADDYRWRDSTIVHMLSRQEYIGNTVNFKTRRKSYKQKKQLKNDPSEWEVFENTHEAIIDRETFEIVQRIRDGRRRVTPLGEMPILSGMLFCADCGAKLYQVRHKEWDHSKEHFVCATYRKIKGGCTSHQIRNVVVEELLIDSIRKITALARDREDEFVEMVSAKSRTATERSLRDSKRELDQAEKRILKLVSIIQRLYEDNIEGKISDERFAKMTDNYEAEQKGLESRIAELKAYISAEKDNAQNTAQFLKLVRKHTDIHELTAEIIREFVEKIYVYNKEIVDGKRAQRIRIVWNYIGEFPLDDTIPLQNITSTANNHSKEKLA
ncbi:MAG: recombinase family protein, partial [Ruminococcus sp.]|nr:recombinase family protein [Ruminococcus sp.]